ncbi:MAG: hypothetical protein GYB66_10675 [Chloroflexi bacterium]|nr:hypothetical protein [Chloroflexota bacterium]
MGIQLDWQVESERQRQHATEDPEARRARQKRRRQMAVAVLSLAVVVCTVLGVILWRLQSVEDRLRQDLLDTVDAEVVALRIGDQTSYMEIRRIASDYWLDLQRQQFEEYQRLKDSGQLELTGNVLSVEMDIDEQRARVVVEERINGIPYEVAWFYWNYTDGDQSGWRRVPPDVSFWGDSRTANANNVRVQYEALDDQFAEALLAVVGRWWSEGCVWLNCQTPLPRLNIEIDPRTYADPAWDLYDEWKLVVTSPLYNGRVRRDRQLDPTLEIFLAEMLAGRIVNHGLGPETSFNPLPYSETTAYADTAWLREALESWLVGRFTGDETRGSAFISNVAAQYGDHVPGGLLAGLEPGARIGPIWQTATGLAISDLSVEQLNLMDWREYFAWRLGLEVRILSNALDLDPTQQRIQHDALYDETDPNALIAADAVRVSFIPGQGPYAVQMLNFSVDQGGGLLATVDYLTDANDPSTVNTAVFRWIGTTWKRVS